MVAKLLSQVGLEKGPTRFQSGSAEPLLLLLGLGAPHSFRDTCRVDISAFLLRFMLAGCLCDGTLGPGPGWLASISSDFLPESKVHRHFFPSPWQPGSFLGLCPQITQLSSQIDLLTLRMYFLSSAWRTYILSLMHQQIFLCLVFCTILCYKCSRGYKD